MSTPWWFFLIAAGLIVMSGFFSGLNLGLMSLAPDELKVVMEGSADEQAKKDAAKIYPCVVRVGSHAFGASAASL